MQAKVKEAADSIRKQYEKEAEEARQLAKSYKGCLTRQQFMLILSCLHPDSRNSTSQERSCEAFNCFKSKELVLCGKTDSSPSFINPVPRTPEEWNKAREAAQEARRRQRANSKGKQGTPPVH